MNLLRFLYLQRVKGFQVPSSPSLDPQTTEFLTTQLKSARLYVEFGSGGSTILADRLGVRTISVEGDRFYASAVRKGLRGNSVTILTPDIGMTGEWGWPLIRRPRKVWQKRWRQYVDAPWDTGCPDLVFVDGRFRVACALESARRLNLGGGTATLIVDDYAPRPQYHEIERFLGAPEIVGRAAVFKIGSQMVPPVGVIDPA